MRAWRKRCSRIRTGPKVSSIWVKAHRTLAEVKDPMEKRRAELNAEADIAAKTALELHPQPSAEQTMRLKQESEDVRAALLLMAKLLPHWPGVSKEECAAAPRADRVRLKREVPMEERHEWIRKDRGWQCAKCMAAVATETRRRQCTSMRCPSVNLNLKKALEADMGPTE